MEKEDEEGGVDDKLQKKVEVEKEEEEGAGDAKGTLTTTPN